METRFAASTRRVGLAFVLTVATASAQTRLMRFEDEVLNPLEGMFAIGAGDVDRDGFEDLAVARPNGGEYRRGTIVVNSGRNGTELWRITGTTFLDNLG